MRLNIFETVSTSWLQNIFFWYWSNFIPFFLLYSKITHSFWGCKEALNFTLHILCIKNLTSIIYIDAENEFEQLSQCYQINEWILYGWLASIDVFIRISLALFLCRGQCSMYRYNQWCLLNNWCLLRCVILWNSI